MQNAKNRKQKHAAIQQFEKTAKKSYHQNHQHCYIDSLISVQNHIKNTHTYTQFSLYFTRKQCFEQLYKSKNHHLKEEIEATLKIKLSNIMQTKQNKMKGKH